MTIQEILNSASREDSKALKAWYGNNWAERVIADHKWAEKNERPHPLQDVTFKECGERKTRASIAWKNIIEKLSLKA